MEPKRLGRRARMHVGSVVMLTALVVAGLLVLPSLALAQATPAPSPSTAPTSAPSATPSPAATTTPQPQPSATPQAAPSLSLSSSAGQAGSSITANGGGFRSGETVTVTFNGQSVGTPTVNSGGTFSLTFNVPGLNPGQYAVLAVGQSSGSSATTSYTINQGNATLSFAPSQADPGTQLTVTGGGFRPGEMVQVTFNGVAAGSATADTNGNISVTFRVPNVAAGAYGVTATGQASGVTVTTSFTVTQPAAGLSFSPPKAPPGVPLTVTGSGFKPGETVDLTFNGPKVGSATADTRGNFSVTFTLPTLSPGDYQATATGETSGTTVTESFTLLPANATPEPTAAPTTTAAPTSTPQTSGGGAPASSAPAIVHDNRYFTQTGYRIENDDAWAFFQQQGQVATFGYPVSREISFLGCPAQMFQRQIIQNCPGQSTALINMLDPDIFPYIHVNGSTFPAPDPAMKADTPVVGSPTYAADMNAFIIANVPDTFNGQPVNFLQTFNTLGGLTIWGAPNSHPAPDPNNGGFIYQRFQRGIMQYIAGQGTVSILLADYLKAIIINQGVPPDLAAESNGSRFSAQYCPGQLLWLCRPADLPGTDLTFAFVMG